MRNPTGPARIDEDRILDLLNGLLPEAERNELLTQLAGDPEAEELLRRHARARERAIARGGPTPQPGRSSLWQRALGFVRAPRPAGLVGFGVAVAIGVALLRGPAGPGPEEYRPLPSGTQTLQLRAGDTLPAELTAGLDAYAAEDWERAVSLLESAPTGETADIVRRLYLGSALAIGGRHEDALEALEPLPLHLVPAPWGTEARWTRALALRKTGRHSEAEAALQGLAGEPGEIAERARALLWE